MPIANAHVLQDAPTLHRAAAKRLIELAQQSIAARGAFHLALSGGRTPQELYRTLAEPEFAAAIAWNRVHVWFGDERCVPPDHPDSNYRMAREMLLTQVPLTPGQVHRIPCESSPQAAADTYTKAIHDHLPPEHGTPTFDLVLLGLGLDGHVASLFPGTEILNEARPRAGAVSVPRLGCWRISLTLPLINAARTVMVLVDGTKKAEIVRRAFEESTTAAPLPIQRVHPTGALEWYLDAAAARLLNIEAEA